MLIDKNGKWLFFCYKNTIQPDLRGWIAAVGYIGDIKTSYVSYKVKNQKIWISKNPTLGTGSYCSLPRNLPVTALDESYRY